MKISLLQTDIAWEDKPENFAKAQRLIKAIKDTDLVVLPELFATGYTMEPQALAEDLDGDTPRFLSGLAKETKTNLLGSFIEKGTPRPKNSALLFNARGEQLLHYSKMRLPSFSGEDQNYSPGEKTEVFELHGDKLGILICYDLRFSELFRELTNRGVKCVIVIANWPQERITHWHTLLRARAIDHQIFIAGVNRVGKSPTTGYTGHTSVIGPNGEIIAAATENKECLVSAEIDLSLVDKVRRELPLGNHNI